MSGISTPPIPGLKPSASTGGLSIVTENGTIDLGAANPWRAHLKTDQQAFHLEKALEIVGNVAFHEGNVPLLRGALLERIHVRCERPSGVHDGGATAGSWITRVLNTVVENSLTGSLSTSTNAVTIPAGSYRVFARAPTQNASVHRCRLVEAGTSTVLAVGSVANSNYQTIGDSVIFGAVITLAASKSVELQTRVSYTQAGYGLGQATGFGDVEIYSELIFERV